MEPTSVYQYFDASGRVLYVGVTSRGVRRAVEHAETKEWWSYCTGCSIEHFPSRDSALEREEYLIKSFAPPFNTIHNKHKAKAQQLYASNRVKPSPRPKNDTSPLRGEVSEELRLRRQQWYKLSPAAKRIAPCVRCGERPGVRGPECLICKPHNHV